MTDEKKGVHFDEARGVIVVDVAYDYEIEISRCKTYEQILGWVFQLSGKSWSTRDLLRSFMVVAFRANDLNPPVLD